MDVIRVYPYLLKLYLVALFNFFAYFNEAMTAVRMPEYSLPIFDWRYKMIVYLIPTVLCLFDRSHSLYYTLAVTPQQDCGEWSSSSIDTLSASSIALDAGVFFDTVYEDLRFGVVFQNLGQPMKFNQQAYSLPLNVKAGANYLITDGLDISLDINKGIETDAVINFGGEYLYPINEETGVALRGGYMSNADGIGVVYQLYTFDYAFVPYGDLSDTQRISIGYKF